MKPFYAFYNRSYGFARAIITFILGLTMVVWPGKAKQYIVLMLGILIILAGVISIIMANTGKGEDKSKGSLLSLNGLVDIVFGLVLVIFPRFFASLIMFLFGILLIFLGGCELFGLARSRKDVKFSWTLFLGPLITTICGVVMFFQPDETANWLFIFFGATLLLYSITEFIATSKIRSAINTLAKESAVAEAKAEVKSEAQDTPFEEVKDDKNEA